METIHTLVFEDAQVEQLYPITLGRPAFAITCGGARLIDGLQRWGGPVSASVRPYLRDLVAADFPALRACHNGRVEKAAGMVLAVNAALVPSISVFERLDGMIRCGRPGIVRYKDRIAAALLPSGQHSIADLAADRFGAALRNLPDALPCEELPLLEYPWDVIRHHLKIFNENLEERLRRGTYTEIRDGVFVAEGVELGDYLAVDVKNGPIVIEAGAKVGPHAFLRGPLLLGPNSKILEHASIKDFTCLGNTAKAGGEVEATIIESYSNKQHHGFLGHSYVGSWVNLGAGTSNSDLKNTYGEVNLEFRGAKYSTGMQFLGCFLGDYVKSAINTSIFTGKIVGPGSMLYGFVTTNVSSFVNYARTFDQITEIPVEVLVATQARMFARRGVTQRPCDAQLLRSMHELTRHERVEIAEEPLTL